MEIVKEFNVFGKTIQLEKSAESELGIENTTLFYVNLFGREVGITETIRNTWIIMGFLIFLAILVRVSIHKFSEIPKGMQNFAESVVEMFTNFLKSTMGEHNVGFTPYFMGLFMFLLCANLMGLFGFRPPTADIATTFALAMITFTMIHGFGIAKKGIKTYIKGYFEPVPFLFPINLIGELAVPISLSFRLFGNILGGSIIMALYYSIPYFFVKIGIPAVLHIYFDVFAGVLQSFIFVMLSMVFISNAIPAPEENE